MAPISKRRKLSDLTSGDTNELLNKIEESRSDLDEGDEDLPDGLIDKLQELHDKLANVKHTSFSKVDPITLASLEILPGPLFLISDKRQEIEDLGLAEIPGCLLIDTTRFLISLVRGHVSAVTKAGCRILINTLLLRVVSVCPGVNIIPEFPIPKTTFNPESGKCSFSGVVDFLVTKIPTQYTEFLLSDPSLTLGRPGNIKESIMSNIFEAKRDNVWAGLSQATIAAASYCQLQGLSVIRGVITSGEQWVFFVYERHTDGTGRVLRFPQYTLGPNLEHLAFVLGLLRDSIDNATTSNLAFFTTP
ncbi:hypothetical protein EV702DRAFT_1012802 [Suillus placidus]|uniref:Uncharacterized protein n=1 Tax=Suillus placidus TaxID=48579 RepID=A0A9P7CY06_9AGAM|nr:hypothetical protein EV702DRAFT_1012802 [Suillus placidus]